jgi:hypothetical protein
MGAAARRALSCSSSLAWRGPRSWNQSRQVDAERYCFAEALSNAGMDLASNPFRRSLSRRSRGATLQTKVVHLFDPDRGVRYHQMIAQGLAAHPEVRVSYSAPVVSFGRLIGPASSRPERDLLEADLIFRPDDGHFGLSEMDEFFDAHDLWDRVVYYDKKDSPELDTQRLQQCCAYLKRSWPIGSERHPRSRPERPVLPMDYSLLAEYYRVAVPKVKDLDVVCPFLDDPIIGARRYALVTGLEDARGRLGNCAIGGFPFRGRDGRRAILEPPQGNPYLDYLSTIKRAKILFTAYPEPQDGDSRTWEAFASGALVFKDKTHIPSAHPFVHGEHCIIYDATSTDSILEAIDLAVYYLAHESERARIASAGWAFARRHHLPASRMDEIMRWVRSPDKKLEDHVLGPVDFA